MTILIMSRREELIKLMVEFFMDDKDICEHLVCTEEEWDSLVDFYTADLSDLPIANPEPGALLDMIV